MGGHGASSGLKGGGGGGGGGIGIEKDTPKSLEKHDVLRDDWEKKHFASLSDSDKEYLRGQFAKVFAQNEFYMNIDYRYLANVMAEHFKNQFETGGASGGASYDANNMTLSNPRVKASYNMFGMDVANMAREDFEKYGSLQSADILTAVNNAPMVYGNTLVRFKKANVFNRTTYTIGDSLGMAGHGYIIGGRVAFADFLGSDIDEVASLVKNVKRARSLTSNAQEWQRVVGGNWSSYLEIQYHGSLTMKDVDSIYYTSGTPGKGVLKGIANLGIKQYTIDRHDGTITEIKE